MPVCMYVCMYVCMHAQLHRWQSSISKSLHRFWFRTEVCDEMQLKAPGERLGAIAEAVCGVTGLGTSILCC